MTPIIPPGHVAVPHGQLPQYGDRIWNEARGYWKPLSSATLSVPVLAGELVIRRATPEDHHAAKHALLSTEAGRTRHAVALAAVRALPSCRTHSFNVFTGGFEVRALRYGVAYWGELAEQHITERRRRGEAV